MGASRRVRRRMQRRDINVARKAYAREHDRRLREMMAQQYAARDEAAASWDGYTADD